MDRLLGKLLNFQNALQRLKEAVEEMAKEQAGTVVRDGVIQRFEFTYELAWKSIKVYLEEQGIVDLNSPKAVFKEAYSQKLITQDEIWLLMLKDRNMTSHVYQEEMAEEIAGRIAGSYVTAFDDLLMALKS